MATVTFTPDEIATFPAGPAGVNGSNGLNGAAGINGTNGTNGSTGPAGPPGINPFHNVKDFGALGDGTTNDTVALNTLLLTPNQTVYFPIGTYMVQGLVCSPDTKIICDPGAVLKKRSAGAILTSNARVTIDGLTFDGALIAGSHAINLNAGHDDAVVRNCTFKNSGDMAILAQSAARVKLQNNISDRDFVCYDCNDATIENNTIYGSFSNGSNISWISSALATSPVHGCKICNNTLFDNAVSGLGAAITAGQFGPQPCSGAIVEGNVFYQNGTGGGAISYSNCPDGTIENNIIRVITGIPLIAQIEIVASSGVICNGNRIDGGGGTYNHALITLTNSSDCVVDGNILSNPGSDINNACILVYADNQTYWGLTPHTASRNIITNNRITLPTGSATAAIRVNANNAAATVDDNIITENICTGDPAASRGIFVGAATGSANRNLISRNIVRNMRRAFYFGNDNNTRLSGNIESGTGFLRTDTAGATVGMVVDGNSWNFATTPPTTDYHFAGERVLNTNPAVAPVNGWVCTVASIPGTWIAC